MPTLPLDQPAFVFGVLFLVILVAPLLAERARAPGLIGLLLAGTLIGPHGLGLLERGGAIEALGGVGLLYLMFAGGIDLDLDGFREDVRDSLIFGGATFVVPGVINFAVATAFGLSLPAAVIISAAFTSHTLLTLPLVQRFGITGNRAITATLGATLLSTVAALIMLAVAAAAGAGETGPVFWVTFPIGLAVFTIATVFGIPRLTRWFFRGVGQDRTVRLTYVLVILFVVSAAADLVRIEPIVGAFLAGMAVNRFVGTGSLVRERLDVLGSSLFIPLFLIATGMLVDPVAVASDPATLLMGGGFALAAIGSKVLSAWPTGRLLGFDRAEITMMVSLTSGQAAGALAAVIVAENLGLVGERVLNATIFVILVTVMVATLLGQRAAPRVAAPARRTAGLGHRIIVPVANPVTAEPLVELAGLVAAADHGEVIAVNVLGFDASASEVDEHRRITAQAETAALRGGAEATSLVRIDASPTAGVLHTVVERGGTCVLLGWKGFANRREDFFGSVIDTVISRASVPVLVTHPGVDEAIERVVLSLTADELSNRGRRTLDLAVEIAVRLATHAQVELTILTQDPVDEARAALAPRTLPEAQWIHDQRSQPIAIRGHTRPGDLVLVGVPPTRGRLGHRAARVGRAIPDRTVMVVVPH